MHNITFGNNAVEALKCFVCRSSDREPSVLKAGKRAATQAGTRSALISSEGKPNDRGLASIIGPSHSVVLSSTNN